MCLTIYSYSKFKGGAHAELFDLRHFGWQIFFRAEINENIHAASISRQNIAGTLHVQRFIALTYPWLIRILELGITTPTKRKTSISNLIFG
jgi:hypothetical protein